MKYVRSTIFLSLTSTLLLTQTLRAQQPFAPTVLASSGGTSSVLWGSYNSALVRSTDRGLTWLPIYVTAAGLPQPPVLTFDIDSGDPNIVYLGTTLAAGGVWKSSDGGTTWVSANAGLPTSGGVIEYFKQIPASPPYFYVKIGGTLYKSYDRATTWRMQALLPGSSPNFDINEQFSSFMFYIDEPTLKIYSSNTEGLTWKTLGGFPGIPTPGSVLGIASLYTNTADLYTSIDGVGHQGQAAYFSPDYGATVTDATSTGLGLFSKFHTKPVGPLYAYGMDGKSFRSIDNGMTWKNVGLVGLATYDITAVDMTDHTILYGIQTNTTPKSLIRSTDAGDTWNTIASTITPTIAKPAAAFNVVLEAGAPYAVAFTVQASEDPTWKFPVTVSTSGESWLTIGSASGSTPLANSFTINTTGLAPGTYTSTLRIDASQTTNKFVTVPIQLTVRPLGAVGPGYQISTIVGNGNANDTNTAGVATSIGIGATRALTFDNNGNLLISAGSRIWQKTGTNLALLAGNGTVGSSGDGLDPTQAAIGDPEALAVDAAGTIYFPEYAFATVRKLSGGNISTPLQLTLSRFGTLFPTGVTGSHSLILDSVNRFVLTVPQGLLRYDLAQLVFLTQYPFVDPYGMVVAPDGSYYVSDRGANKIFHVSPTFQVSLFAGTGVPGFSGDGGPALRANFNSPSGLVMDPQGTLYIADTGNQRVRAIAADGTIRTIAGSGLVGFAGDGQTSDFASFRGPVALAIDNAGNLYVGDSANNRVRELTPHALQSAPPPVITSVTTSDGGSDISQNDFISIYGTNLAASVTSGSLANQLAGVSVTVNSKPALLSYVSPGQINALTPLDSTVGPVPVVVTNNGVLSASFTANLRAVTPAFLLFDAARHVTATHADYSLLGPASLGAGFTPGAPGETIVTYAVGFGLPSNVAASGTNPTAGPLSPLPVCQVAGTPATVTFAGLNGFPGLFQLNIVIPPGTPNGDSALACTYSGQATAPGTLVNVQQH
jgi:uncharacterized protein (TIGR03437 family)